MSLATKLKYSSGASLPDPVTISETFSNEIWGPYQAGAARGVGLDLSGEGGLVFVQNRTLGYGYVAGSPLIGTNIALKPFNSGGAVSANGTFASFTNNGYTLGASLYTNDHTYGYLQFAGHAFRNCPRFFDSISYTGDGSADRTIPHDIGMEVGLAIVKSTSVANDWIVYHRGVTGSQPYLIFNSESPAASSGAPIPISTTSTNFTVHSGGTQSYHKLNDSGTDYVAMLWAHDPNPDGVVQCGSYVGNGLAAGPEIDLGWKPQWVMIRRTDGNGDWVVMDNLRPGGDVWNRVLEMNYEKSEGNVSAYVEATATGFKITTNQYTNVNASGGDYVYLAVRE
jgi:hypothetical protein